MKTATLMGRDFECKKSTASRFHLCHTMSPTIRWEEHSEPQPGSLTGLMRKIIEKSKTGNQTDPRDWGILSLSLKTNADIWNKPAKHNIWKTMTRILNKTGAMTATTITKWLMGKTN